ncbi:MAG: hypothetical protein H6993_13790 [Pseudomonadales bacterium]|nr:hypothetical protein [Pseudomonadales bacterium]MCP5185032.1 hypothetical protein [Pseudomonadales bacterium]
MTASKPMERPDATPSERRTGTEDRRVNAEDRRNSERVLDDPVPRRNPDTTDRRRQR